MVWLLISGHTNGDLESIKFENELMSDLEFDILDELYFLIHFNDLIGELDMSDDEIKPVLIKLFKKDWLRCYSEPDVEIESSQVDLDINFRNYYYLASKTGMKAHNG